MEGAGVRETSPGVSWTGATSGVRETSAGAGAGMRETSTGVSWTGATSRVRVAGGGVSSTFTAGVSRTGGTFKETSPRVSWTEATSGVGGGGVSSTFMSRGRFDALVETSDESLRVLFLAGVIRVECLVGWKVEIWLPRFKSVRILTVKL